jgi:hypothetical protein
VSTRDFELRSLLAPFASAQESRGTIVGRITDQTGAVIAGAEVRATNLATNVTGTSRSNEQGNFVLPYLLSVDYTVHSSLSGFKKFAREGIQMRIGDTVELNIQMQVGDAAESVEVKAETPLLATTEVELQLTASPDGRMDRAGPPGAWGVNSGITATSILSFPVQQRPNSRFETLSLGLFGVLAHPVFKLPDADLVRCACAAGTGRWPAQTPRRATQPRPSCRCRPVGSSVLAIACRVARRHAELTTGNSRLWPGTFRAWASSKAQ